MNPTVLPELRVVDQPSTFQHIKNVLQVTLRGEDRHAPVYVVFQDKGDQKWRFHEEMSGHVTSTSGQHFFSKSNAKRAAYVHARRVGGSVRVEE